MLSRSFQALMWINILPSSLVLNYFLVFLFFTLSILNFRVFFFNFSLFLDISKSFYCTLTATRFKLKHFNSLQLYSEAFSSYLKAHSPYLRSFLVSYESKFSFEALLVLQAHWSNLDQSISICPNLKRLLVSHCSWFKSNVFQMLLVLVWKVFCLPVPFQCL